MKVVTLLARSVTVNVESFTETGASQRPACCLDHAVPKAYDVPASTVAAITGVHVDCSRFAARKHDGRIPKELSELSAALRQDFDRDAAYPDLSSMGYKLIGVWPCREPLENKVHLLYRSTVKDLNDTLSIFVQPVDTSRCTGRRYVYGCSASHTPCLRLVLMTASMTGLSMSAPSARRRTRRSRFSGGTNCRTTIGTGLTRG